MTERPILFSGPMVRALLDGRKTQTRRIIKPQPDWVLPEPCCSTTVEGWQGPIDRATWACNADPTADLRRCPYGGPGDTLWVCEAWALHERFTDVGRVVYAATANRSWTEAHRDIPIAAIGDRPARPFQLGFKPSIHMPRWASRLTLEITDVRAERLQDISATDARAEGCEPVHMQPGGPTGDPGKGWLCYRAGFESLWDTINGKKAPWATNPWVWAVTFRVVTP